MDFCVHPGHCEFIHLLGPFSHPAANASIAFVSC